jgi:hypothetical protein
MTYRIEIQADTLPELAHRMVLMGAQLQRQSAEAEEAEKTAEPKAKPKAKEKEAPELNFEQDVASRVLRLVKAEGKELVADILADFGVKRASEVDPQQWPDLIVRLDEELA